MRTKYFVAILVLLVLALPASPARAGGVVTVCDEAHLLAALAGGGTVTFACSGTITLTATITISTDTTIDGSGQAVTISGDDAIRVLTVNAGVILNLNRLTIADGSAPAYEGGGGIDNYGTLSVSNSIFSNNYGSQGGGIYNDHGGTLTVTNSTFSNNGGGYGGGITSALGGTVAVSNSIFSNNGGSYGGGIYIPGDYYAESATLTVSNSIFSNNYGSYGGGIGGDGTIIVDSCAFNGNGSDYGGGISYGGHYSTLTVRNSTFSGNSASGQGGGIYNSGSATVSNSTFSGNNSGSGGGLSNDWDGTLTVSNSTLDSNDVTYDGGNIYNYYGSVVLQNTIVANSPTGGNCAGGTVTDGGGNLSYPDNTCPGINADPLLGPLQDNGGPTETMALGPGSAAIDAADDAICAAPPVNNLDQRGVTRPQGPHCDIGAVEQEQGQPPSEADLTLAKFSDPEPAVTRGSPLVYTLTVENFGPGDAQDVVISDTLPAGVTPTGLVELPLGTVTAGAAASEELAVTVDTSTIGLITNEATVTTSTPETDTTNNSASLVTMVTDDKECTRLVPYWQYQFLLASPTRDFDDATLQAFLDITNYASSIFSEEVPTSTLQEAYNLLWIVRPNLREGVEQRLLAGWLNFAQGAVGWYELIDTNKDGMADTPFHEVMAMAEAILANPDATNQELAMAGALAMAVNVQDGSNPACRQLAKADPVGINWSFLPLIPHRWR